MCQELGIEVDSKVVPQIAYGFAGGIGNTGSVCGSVIGAVMAIGLARERADTWEEGLRTLEVVQEFRRRFEAETESIECRELTGMDLSTDEGRDRFMESDTPMMVCFPAVSTAYRLVVELVRETA